MVEMLGSLYGGAKYLRASASVCVRVSSGLEGNYKCESETAGERRGREPSLNTFQNKRASVRFKVEAAIKVDETQIGARLLRLFCFCM